MTKIQSIFSIFLILLFSPPCDIVYSKHSMNNYQDPLCDGYIENAPRISAILARPCYRHIISHSWALEQPKALFYALLPYLSPAAPLPPPLRATVILSNALSPVPPQTDSKVVDGTINETVLPILSRDIRIRVLQNHGRRHWLIPRKSQRGEIGRGLGGWSMGRLGGRLRAAPGCGLSGLGARVWGLRCVRQWVRFPSYTHRVFSSNCNFPENLRN